MGNEFWTPCKKKLESEFGTSEFTNKEQCDYVKNDCGGAGPFPAFRRLDCEEEIPTEAWEYYKTFSKRCLRGDDGIPPGETPSDNPPVPSPTNKPYPSPTPPADKPTPKPYIPSDDPKPYVPSSDTGNKEKKKSRWFRNLVIFCALGGVGYYVY